MAKLIRVVWEGDIPNFRSKCNIPVGKAMKSQIFAIPCTKVKGCLEIYPGGVSEQYKDYVSVFLELTDYDEDKNVELMGKFDFWISKDGRSKRRSGVLDYSLEKSFGYPDYIKRDYILDSENGILVDEELTFGCEIHVSVSIMCSGDENEETIDKKRFLKDTGHMLFSTDVALKIHGQCFMAHKLVLMARSKKFKKMFMEQSKKTEFQIEDVPAEFMNDLLRYIYTGEVNVVGLKPMDFWEIVCRYDLINPKLPIRCENELIDKISNKHAVELLQFGHDLHLKNLYDHYSSHVSKYIHKIVRLKSFRKVLKISKATGLYASKSPKLQGKCEKELIDKIGK